MSKVFVSNITSIKERIMSMSVLSTISMKVAEAVITNPTVIADIIQYMK